LVESLGEFYPEALWQWCAVHFYRNVWTAVPTSAVGAFPDGKSALMLAAARLRYVAGTKRGTRLYLDMNRLAEASEAA
jgi:hypothetical protein